MEKEMAGRPAFSEEFKELMQKVENRDTAKRMSDEELSSLKKIIDDEIIRREVVRHIQILANQLK